MGAPLPDPQVLSHFAGGRYLRGGNSLVMCDGDTVKPRSMAFFSFCVAFALACAPRSNRAPDPAPPPVTLPSSAPASQGDPQPALPARSEPPADQSFACGEHRCRVGSESCCTGGDVAVCAPNALPDPPNVGQLWAAQIELCQASPYDVQLDGIARCRSSSHCAEGELCCNEALWSGATALVCRAAKTDAACDYGEVCTSDAPCRTSNAVCVKGQCRPRSDLECDRAPCDLTTHTCVATSPSSPKLSCVADSQIRAWRNEGRPIFDVTCLGHGDCLPGELCRTAQGRAFCQATDNGMTGTLCGSVADCPKDLCKLAPANQKKRVCARDPAMWHATCDCK